MKENIISLKLVGLLIVLFALFGNSDCLLGQDVQELQNDVRDYQFVDIHLHPCVKPFNSRHVEELNMWEHIDHSCSPGYAKWYADGRPEVPRVSIEF